MQELRPRVSKHIDRPIAGESHYLHVLEWPRNGEPSLGRVKHRPVERPQSMLTNSLDPSFSIPVFPLSSIRRSKSLGGVFLLSRSCRAKRVRPNDDFLRVLSSPRITVCTFRRGHERRSPGKITNRCAISRLYRDRLVSG